MKYKQYLVKYLGYDNQKGCFMFETKHGKQPFMSYEVCWGIGKFIGLSDVVQHMNSKIGAYYKAIAYFIDYGYYVERIMSERTGSYTYALFDASNDIDTEVRYSSEAQIPKNHLGKQVYRYRKKAILYETTARD